MKNLIQRFNNIKYRNKLVILMIITSLVPVVILSLFTQWRMRRILRNDEISVMQSTFDQTIDALESKVQVYENVMNYLGFSQGLREVMETVYDSDYEAYLAYTNVADPLLSTPRFYHNEINSITLYAKNIEVRHGDTLAPLDSLSANSWYSQVTDTQDICWLAAGGAQREIILVRHFFDNSGISAALALHLDYYKIMESLDSIVRDNTGILLESDAGDVIYASADIDERYMPPDFNKLDSDSIRTSYVCVEGGLSGTGWHMLLYKPSAVIDATVGEMLWDYAIVVIICLLLVFLLAQLFSGHVVSRVEKLTENMNKVNIGYRDVTVDSEDKDEIGVLIRTFKRMMAEINRLIDEAYAGKIALQEAEMKALQAQINPHFLYNSLSIINWKAIQAEQPEISRMTLALSAFYRTSLNHGESMTILANEIKNIDAYLEIQLVMHDDDFQVEKNIDESILQYPVPKLILQPIVENAIDHGLDASGVEHKKIWLEVFQEDGTIILVVRDNGAGMTEETVEKLLTYRSPGYGMKNVNDRIVLLYGRSYRMRIESVPGEGTTVTLRIPKKMEGITENEKTYRRYHYTSGDADRDTVLGTEETKCRRPGGTDEGSRNG